MTIGYTTFRGKRVSKKWATVLRHIESATGAKLQINSGHRTLLEQTRLYRQNMLNGRPRPGRPLTAVPSPNAPHIRVGRASHALDLEAPSSAGLVARHLRSHGLNPKFPVPGEPWHLEITEAELTKIHKELTK